MNEKEELIVNYMSSKVGGSIDKMETNANDMLKYITGILTILTGLATYLKIGYQYLIIPLVLLISGIVGFIRTIEPIKQGYVVGEVYSCCNAYDTVLRKKNFWVKIGYYCSYLGILLFAIIIVIVHK